MSNFADRLSEADALFDQNKVKENYDILNGLFKNDVKDPQLLWRFARANYDMACETDALDSSQEFTDTGLNLISDAKKQIPNEFNIYKWEGILLGKKGQFLSTKEKIANAYTIRDNFKKAIELNPKDATTQYCMAQWCWSILQISWVERKAAALIFGTPPTSTYEECEEHLRSSWELNGDAIHTALLFGDLRYQQKRYAEAKEWFVKAQGCTAETDNQKRQVKEAKDKAAKC